jgi:hypothetical protein
MSRPDALLPFLGPDTDGDQFEAFCHDLLARTPGFRDVRRWGVSGDEQGGVDLLATYDGGEWAFQCKREKTFGPKKAERAIEEATHPADQYVLLLGRPATRDARRTIEGAGWKLWDATDLSQRVRALSDESAVQLVRAHFGPAVAEGFLGVSADLPWQPLDAFFEPFLQPDHLFSHAHTLVGREADVERVVAFVSGDARVAILSGRGGLGKSRLALEAGRRLEASGVAVRVVDPDRPVRRDDLRVLPPGDPVLLVADDAHRRDDVAALARLATDARARGRDVRLLLTTRPYGVDALRAAVATGGVDPGETLALPALSDLTTDDLRALARDALGPVADEFLVHRLVDAVGDSPLVLSLGAALVRRGKIDPGHLRTDGDVRRTVLARFRDEAVGAVTPSVPARHALQTLRVTAAAGPLQTDRDAVVEAAADVAGLDPVAFRQALGALEAAGVLVRRGRQVRVSPDVLADHLLAEAALLPDGTSTGYAERVFETLAPHAGPTVLRNLAELDWRQREADAPSDLLARTWTTIAESFHRGDAAARVRVLELVTPAAVYLPARVLDLCRLAADDLAAPSTAGYGSHQENVLRKLPELLKRVAHTLGTDRLGDALGLLWRLAQDDSNDRLQPYPAAAERALVELARPGRYRSHRWHHAVLDAAERWAAAQATRLAAWDGDPAALPRVPVSRVIAPALDRSVDLSWSDGNAFYIRNGWPNAHLPPVRAVRRRALDLLERFGLDGGPAAAFAAAGPLAEHVLDRTPYDGPTDPDVLGAFASESRRALVALRHLLDAYPDPHLADVVWRRTHWFAGRSAPGLRRRAVRQLRCQIESVPDWALARALHRRQDRWVQADNDDDGSSSWAAHGARSEAKQADAAREYLDQGLSPDVAADDLAGRLDAIAQLDAWTHTSGHLMPPFPSGFLEALGRISPAYARRLAGAFIERDPQAHASHVAALLAGARARGAALDRLLALGEGGPPERLAAAQALHAVFWRGAATDDEWILLERLLADPDGDVQRVAVDAWQGALSQTPERARPLLASVAPLGHQAASIELFTTARHHVEGPLTDDEADHLLAHARTMPQIGDHGVLDALKAHVERDPDAVYDLLADRVRRESAELRAVPSHPQVPLFEAAPDSVRERLLARALRLRAEAEGPAVSFAAQQLVNLLASGFPTIALDATLALLRGTADEAGVAFDVLEDAPKAFPLERPDDVRAVLQAAEQGGGADRRQRAERSLRFAAASGMRSRTPPNPCPDDVHQRDRARALADEHRADSHLGRFYTSLAEAAEASIERDRLDDLEEGRG